MRRLAARCPEIAAAGTGLRLVLAVAFGLSAPALGFPGSVLVVAPKSPPKGVDAKALLRALEVYLQDFPHEVAEVDQVPEDSARQLAQGSDLASKKGARYAVWFRWSGLEWSPLFSTYVAELGSPEVRLVSFAVEWPKAPDAPFYRLVGLKLRSALRAAAEPPVAPEPRVEAPPPVEAAVDAGTVSEPARWAVEVGVAARVPPGPFEVVPALGASAHYEAEAWSVGVGASRSLAETRVTAVGTGETSVTRLVAVGGRRVVGPGKGKLSLWALVEAGVLFVHSTAHLTDEEEVRSHSDTLPVVSAQLMGSWRVVKELEVRAGPTLDIYPTALKILALETVVYSSGRVQPGLEVRLRAAF